MSRLTHALAGRADGLAADTRRDIRLGARWASREAPGQVVPGSGGMDLMEISAPGSNRRRRPLADYLPAGVPLMVNPRGFRPGSVRNDVFFPAIPLVLQHCPKPAFSACHGGAGRSRPAGGAPQFGEPALPPAHLPQAQVWDLFLRADVIVSSASTTARRIRCWKQWRVAVSRCRGYRIDPRVGHSRGERPAGRADQAVQRCRRDLDCARKFRFAPPGSGVEPRHDPRARRGGGGAGENPHILRIDCRSGIILAIKKRQLSRFLIARI